MNFLHWLGMVGGLLYLFVSAARMLIYFMGGPVDTPTPFTKKELEDMRSHNVD